MIRKLPTALCCAAAAAAAWALPQAARADTVVLKRGATVRGQVVAEDRDQIVLRVNDEGTITIRKAEIAELVQDEHRGEEYVDRNTMTVRSETPEAPEAEAGADTTSVEASAPSEAFRAGPARSAQGQAASAPRSAAGARERSANPLAFSPEVSPQVRQRLTPVRATILSELSELGPSPEQRLQEIQVDAQTAAQIRQEIANFRMWERRRSVQGGGGILQRRRGSGGAATGPIQTGPVVRQSRGSARMQRWNRRDALLERYGNAAIPFLAEAAGGETYWSARLSAQALGILAAQEGEPGERATWLTNYLDAPAAMIELFGEGPTNERVGLHLELDESLQAITHAWDVEGYEEWAAFWPQERARWLAEQRRKELRREELRSDLAQVLRGELPREWQDAAGSLPAGARTEEVPQEQ